jgi:dihydroneopterin aldolase
VCVSIAVFYAFILKKHAAKTGKRMAQDIVYIRDLEVRTVIGIYDWERQIKQKVSMDLEMAADIARAAKTDAIADTLDYKSIAKAVIAFTEASSFQLVETLAERIAEIITKDFGVSWLRLRVSKPGAVRGSRDVGVVIERGERA